VTRPVDDPAERTLSQAAVGDWLASLDGFVANHGVRDTRALLERLQARAARHGAVPPAAIPRTPYVDSVRPRGAYPGDEALEDRIEALVRWNAAAMVARANRSRPGAGGHLSSFASAATLFEVGFQHFFRGFDHPEGGDTLFLQGHASPGIYARMYLEGRLTENDLDAFRHELRRGGGLPSYPHPWLRPDLWETPSVSMGLAAISAIHQARVDRYAQARGLVERPGRVWAILGDGEMDEPESTGALLEAARDGLDDLVFVIDCNLQRLDGPVRGSGHVIQDLEGLFAGAGWRVIKCLWSSAWAPLFREDRAGALAARLEAVPDGDWQRIAAGGPAVLRELVFEADDALAGLLDGWSDEDLARLGRGGHDRAMGHAALAAAEAEDARPTVVLAQTVKGWGFGEAGEGLNVSHKVKDLEGDALRAFRDRLGVPVSDEALDELPYVSGDETVRRYLGERRRALGGARPVGRPSAAPSLETPSTDRFTRFHEGSGEREVTTTVALVRLLGDLLRDDAVGDRLVPIVPDEARTFGIETLFRKVGIWSASPPRYTPVDHETLLAYREATDGQILQEGITEAGAMGSFIAAGTAYRRHQTPLLPFYFFYSMFGFQRVGDLIWAAADARARGFLVGATAGRTTLAGEGLQHQDGQSQLFAMAHPTVDAWDPAFAYELAVIVEDGLRRMLSGDEETLQYLTVTNEPTVQPPMPEGARPGILEGMHRVATRHPGEAGDGEPTAGVALLASGIAVQAALQAADELSDAWGVAADVWSVTSWKKLQEDGVACARRARLHPEEPAPRPLVARRLGGEDDEDRDGVGSSGPHATVAISDWVRAVPAAAIGASLEHPAEILGTDGFGRSDSRAGLRDFFEVDHRHGTVAGLRGLCRAGMVPPERVSEALRRYGIDPDRPDPSRA